MSGRWQERRRWWTSWNMTSTAGRADNLTFDTGERTDELAQRILSVGTTSEFDPVLAEIILRWWSPPGGVVMDPFAGGSVRGIVASMRGREYHGVDLSAAQVEANEDAYWRVCAELDTVGPEPLWYRGDATKWLPTIKADLVMSCPPYGSLERYSDDPDDLSTMKWPDFCAAYRTAVARAVRRLKDDRFAVFVVGNYREGDWYRNLEGLTIDAFESAGAAYYSQVILKNSTASSGMRASASFDIGRKPIAVHQLVLVFVKGSWRQAAAAAERFNTDEAYQ
jgi:hypothetical protein